MLALATHAVRDRPRLHGVLMMLGMFGTAIFYGDGVITPAISVLSAMEGLEVAAPSLHLHPAADAAGADWLFAVQRFGTGGIGRAFGPITLVWFGVLVALGLPHVIEHRRCWWRWIRGMRSASSSATRWWPSSASGPWCCA